MRKNDSGEFMNLKETAIFLGVSLSTVRKIVKTEGFPAKKLGKRTYRVSKTELICWLNKERPFG